MNHGSRLFKQSLLYRLMSSFQAGPSMQAPHGSRKKGHNLFFSCDEKPLGSVREKNGAARAAFTMFFIFVSATFKAPGQVPHSLRFAGSSPLRRLRVDARLAPGNSQCSRPLKHDCNISIRCRGGLFCHSLIYSGAFKPTTTYRWHSNQRHSPKKAVFHITTRSW